MVTEADLEQVTDKNLPSFLAAIAGPVVVILLLALRPIVGISIDPLIALPIGGIVLRADQEYYFLYGIWTEQSSGGIYSFGRNRYFGRNH